MALEPIKISFVVGGQDRIKNIIGDLEKRMDRANKLKVQGEKKAGEESIKIADRVAKEKQKLLDRSLKLEQKQRDMAAKLDLKAAEKASKEKLAIRNKINSLEVRDAQRMQRDIEREQTRNVRMSEQRSRSFGQGAAGVLGRGVGRVVGIAGRVAGMASAIGGGFALTDALQSGIRREAAAGVIIRGSADRGDVTNKGLNAQASATTIATGTKHDDIMSGMGMFVRRTGSIKEGVKIMQDLAEAAASTGAEMEDLGATAGDVYTKLKDIDQTKDVMAVLVEQGRRGAIDIKDLGQYGARLTGTSKDYAGGAGKNIGMLSALAQMAKTAGLADDAATATMAVERFDTDLTKHAGKLKKGTVYDKNGNKKGIEEILVGAMRDTGGDERKLIKVFGDRSYKMISGVRQTYRAAGGGKAGEEAVHKMFREFAVNPEEARAKIKSDVAERMKESEAKIAVAMEKMEEAFSSRLLPLLPGLIEQFSRLVPVLSGMLDSVIAGDWAGLITKVGGALVTAVEEHWGGIGTLIGASIAFEIAKAGIGAAVQAAVVAAISAAGAGTAVGAAAALPVAGAAYLTYKSVSDTNKGEASAKGAIAMGDDTEDAAKAKIAALTPMIAKAKAQAQVGFGDPDSSAGAGPDSEFGMFRNMTGGASDAGASGALKQLDAMSAALEKASVSLAKFADSAGSTNPAQGAPTQPIGSRPTQ